MIPCSNCMKSPSNINIPFPTTLRSRCWQEGSHCSCSDLSTRTIIYWLRVFVKASMETRKWRPRLILIVLGGLPESFPRKNKVNFCTMFCEGKEKILKRPKVIRIKLYRDISWLCPQENMFNPRCTFANISASLIRDCGPARFPAARWAPVPRKVWCLSDTTAQVNRRANPLFLFSTTPFQSETSELSINLWCHFHRSYFSRLTWCHSFLFRDHKF